MLPGARRRLYLVAVLASQTDPVLAVDGRGVVMVANAAAMSASGLAESELTGMSLQALTGDAQLAQGLTSQCYRCPRARCRLGASATCLKPSRCTRPVARWQARCSRSRLSQVAGTALLANPWLGNVRQLQNVIVRAVTLSEAPVVDAADLELAATDNTADAGHGPLDEVGSLEQAVSRFEHQLLQRLFAQYPSSRKLAQRLQTPHSAIATRLRKYGIGT